MKVLQKVFLSRQAKDVTFTLSLEDLKFFNSDPKWVYEPGDFKVMVGGNSRDVQEAGFVLTK